MMKRIFGGILVLAGCAALIALGVWQLHRLQWKLGLIADIAAQASLDPEKVSLSIQLDDPGNNFHRGFLQGRYLRNKDVRVGPHMDGDRLGYWVVSPLKLFGGRIVLVNRGWIEQSAAPPAPPKAMEFITGTLRESDRAGAPVAGDAQSWHRLDVAGIAKALNLPDVAPLALFMEGSRPKDDPRLIPAPVVASLRNEHLQYAIFWFVMAAVLFGCYVVFSLRGRH